MCMVHVHMCVQVCIPMYGCGDQRKTSSVLLYSCRPYFLKTGSLTECGARLAGCDSEQSSCLYSSIVLELQAFMTITIFFHIDFRNLNLNTHSCDIHGLSH